MTQLTGTLLLAASLSASARPAPLALLDVPFISQSEALCGGAAAAMVLRYWGAAGVRAEDFAPLVDPRAGGIQTAALARALLERGWSAIAAAGTPALVQAEMGGGRPVIALMEDRPGAFHYVVIVGWHDRAVVLHDPARTPYVLMRPAEFERRWAAAGRWMLAVAPRPRDGNAGGSTAVAPPPAVHDSRSIPEASACDALVGEGVALAQRRELPEAERLLAEAAYRCDGAGPLRELAGVRLLQRRWVEVTDLAARAVALDPSDTHAWRLLAAGRYVSGDHRGALHAWNHAGELIIDFVAIHGLERTTHRAVERILELHPGDVLTWHGLERARRRLAELPAARATRLEYLARPQGRAEVRAHVAEHALLPKGRLSWAAIGLRAAATREVAVALGSLTGGGERLEARWRFWPNRPGAGLRARMPARGMGVLAIDVSAERQPFTDEDLAAAERVVARAALADWASGGVRWELTGGLERWRNHGAFAVAGGRASVEAGRLTAAFGVDQWLGAASYAGAAATASWRSSAAARGAVLLAAAGIHAIQAAAPLDLWPAGDTGQARPVLLRAHPVLDAGHLRVERLGRRVVHATAEAQRWWAIRGIPVGGALFADAARTSARRALDPVVDVDVGLGLRLALPASSGTFRVDLAHGLRDGRQALSLAWQP